MQLSVISQDYTNLLIFDYDGVGPMSHDFMHNLNYRFFCWECNKTNLKYVNIYCVTSFHYITDKQTWNTITTSKDITL